MIDPDEASEARVHLDNAGGGSRKYPVQVDKGKGSGNAAATSRQRRDRERGRDRAVFPMVCSGRLANTPDSQRANRWVECQTGWCPTHSQQVYGNKKAITMLLEAD